MTALYIIAAVVIVFAALLITRAGLIAEYSSDGYYVAVRIGFVTLRVMPRKKKEKPERTKRKQKASRQEVKEKKGGTVDELRLYLPSIIDFFKEFKRKLQFELTVWYMAAGEDPAKAAMSFGKASAAMGIITGVLENALNIKKRDFRASISFDETKPRVYLKAAASMRAGQLLSLVIRLGLYKLSNRAEKKPKKERWTRLWKNASWET